MSGMDLCAIKIHLRNDLPTPQVLCEKNKTQKSQKRGMYDLRTST